MLQGHVQLYHEGDWNHICSVRTASVVIWPTLSAGTSATNGTG